MRNKCQELCRYFSENHIFDHIWRILIVALIGLFLKNSLDTYEMKRWYEKASVEIHEIHEDVRNIKNVFDSNDIEFDCP